MPNSRLGSSSDHSATNLTDVNPSNSLEGFVKDVVGDESFKIEHDFGLGYVELKSTEADRRQAAQDIRCVEDIVIELLRNSRDAASKNILIATYRHANVRSLIIIDDGVGIPESMHENVFKPRVTSKLNTAHMDSWGMHGRGMALYSIKERSVNSCICNSSPGNGCSIRIDIDVSKVPEKRDQSTFPYFEIVDSTHAMRGPKNILRTIAEFAITHKKELNVYCGSPSEICATLLKIGNAAIPPRKRIFGESSESQKLIELLSFASSAESFTETAGSLGLDLSPRSSRRILDGEISPLISMFERVEKESFPSSPHESRFPKSLNADAETNAHAQTDSTTYLNSDAFSLPKISNEDIRELRQRSESSFKEIADKYYLKPTDVKITQCDRKVIIEIDVACLE